MSEEPTTSLARRVGTYEYGHHFVNPTAGFAAPDCPSFMRICGVTTPPEFMSL